MYPIKIVSPQVQELLESIGEKFPQNMRYEFDNATHFVELNAKTMANKLFRLLIYQSEIRKKLSQKAQSIIFVSAADKSNFFSKKAILIPKKQEKSIFGTATAAFEKFIALRAGLKTNNQVNPK